MDFGVCALLRGSVFVLFVSPSFFFCAVVVVGNSGHVEPVSSLSVSRHDNGPFLCSEYTTTLSLLEKQPSIQHLPVTSNPSSTKHQSRLK